MAIWRMRTACLIPKATNTHSEYVIPLFQPQQWSHERGLMLSYTYIGCIVIKKTADIKHIQLLGGGGGGVNVLNLKKIIFCYQLIFIYYAKYIEVQ